MPIDLDSYPELIPWLAWAAEDKARRWLAANVRRAQFSRLSDKELLAELGAIPSQHDLSSLLDVACDRVERGSRRFQRGVSAVLARLATKHPGPGRDAVAVDRAIRRLLHRLPDVVGRSVAIESLRSRRRDRKAAAWKYYRRHGLDDESRDVLRGEFRHEDHAEFRKLVAGDAPLVELLGADAVLEIAPNRYWRTKAVEGLMNSNGRAADRARVRYPAEWLWAVALRRDLSRLPAVLVLLQENGTDPDLVNRVLLCVMELGDRTAIDQTLKAADRVLESESSGPPDALDR